MKTILPILAVAALALAAVPVVGASNPIGDPSDTTFCSGSLKGESQTCPYMLCWHPTYNEYGRVAWCQLTFYYPCQYCVPQQFDAAPRAPAVPVSGSLSLLP